MKIQIMILNQMMIKMKTMNKKPKNEKKSMINMNKILMNN